MQIIARAAQMKELDRRAIEEYQIPSIQLMENAATAVADEAERLLEWGDCDKIEYAPEPSVHIIGGSSSVAVIGTADTPEEQAQLDEAVKLLEERQNDPKKRVAVFCGPGNNGGDGIAAARLLRERGYHVRAFLVGSRDRMTPDALEMERRLAAQGGVLEDFKRESLPQMAWLSTCDLMVDALFGIGLTRELEGDFLTATQWMRGERCPVVSCDIPSGLETDTGRVLGGAVRATSTVTFTHPKSGHFLGDGAEYTGRLVAASIGIPYELAGSLDECPAVLDGDDVRLPRRRRDSHKGSYGKIYMLAGATGYTGAPVLAAEGAVRTGAGLVHLGVPQEIYPIVAVKCGSAMPYPLPKGYGEILQKAAQCTAALIGPGLGRAMGTEELVRSLARDLELPLVLDADGINALAGHINILDGRQAPTILTPHDGEFARLTGTALPIENRMWVAEKFARAHRCHLVLKGHRTIVATPEGRVFINSTGNPGMAKGGSGDVLAGMLVSLIAQDIGLSLDEAVCAAVYLHGEAGDRAARRLGEYSMTPEDLLACLPEVMKERTR